MRDRRVGQWQGAGAGVVLEGRCVCVCVCVCVGGGVERHSMECLDTAFPFLYGFLKHFYLVGATQFRSLSPTHRHTHTTKKL
jgi:hypothetical protein